MYLQKQFRKYMNTKIFSAKITQKIILKKTNLVNSDAKNNARNQTNDNQGQN